jgi:hypothetical protein
MAANFVTARPGDHSDAVTGIVAPAANQQHNTVLQS